MAEEGGVSADVDRDFKDLSAMIDASAELQSLLRSPLTNRQQQKNGVLALAEQAKFCQLTARFLGVVSDNRRLAILPQIIMAFQAELRRRRGEVEAKVETACALTPAQTKALQEQLSRATGSAVTLNVTVNEALLGGMIVTVGSRMIDDSVRRKLERLQRAMSSGSNENQVSLKEVG